MRRDGGHRRRSPSSTGPCRLTCSLPPTVPLLDHVMIMPYQKAMHLSNYILWRLLTDKRYVLGATCDCIPGHCTESFPWSFSRSPIAHFSPYYSPNSLTSHRTHRWESFWRNWEWITTRTRAISESEFNSVEDSWRSIRIRRSRAVSTAPHSREE